MFTCAPIWRSHLEWNDFFNLKTDHFTKNKRSLIFFVYIFRVKTKSITTLLHSHEIVTKLYGIV